MKEVRVAKIAVDWASERDESVRQMGESILSFGERFGAHSPASSQTPPWHPISPPSLLLLTLTS